MNYGRKKNNISNPSFGYHIFPSNSVISHHQHCFSKNKEDITYIETEIDYDVLGERKNLEKTLPGYVKHINKTTNLEDIINNLMRKI